MTLLELLSLLRKHTKMVVAFPVAFAVAMAIFTLFMPNEYTAQTSMYVLSKTDETSTTTTLNSDLSAGQMLANDVASIAESDRVQMNVAEGLGYENLDEFDIDVESSTTTRLITLSVTGKDPQEAANVANAFVDNVSTTAASVMEVKAVNVVDQAQAPEEPSGPKRLLYIAVAFLLGLFIAVAVIVIADMVNVRARDDDDVTELIGVPVIGHFPAIE